MSDGTEQIVPTSVHELATSLDSALTPLFTEAQEKFTEACELNGPAFSQYGVELQATYPGIAHLALRDLQSKASAVEAIITGLHSTAGVWEFSEQASTTKTSG
ncbi:hypothetical protein [Jatrophihabitans endophyticus]|uniref:hypothetical protein n=1 Tax=Jatrophihabitans endophyticus TaxID=1206085 RepID=UPI0019EDCA82|nr:hypothetical protein [Jatrophihabitans endophyticus]MBE7186739.1 hypothetical protein [Jatrophihabitans endophyticus]